MIGIYKITSPSNKVYIGQSVNIHKRIINYKSLQCEKQIKLYSSLKKYGFESHIVEVIEECEIEMLNKKERYWQDFYNCIGKNGLNCRLTETTEKSGILSEETINKIRKNRKGITPVYKDNASRILKIKTSLTGKKLSEEHKKSMSKSQTGLKRSPEAIKKSAESRRGLKFSDDFKDKIRKRQTGKTNSFAKIVLNTETGIFYDTADEAAKSMGWTYNKMNHYMNGRIKRKIPFIYV